MPKVIKFTKLNPKIPTDSQFNAPIIVRISAITEKTLKTFFNAFFLLVSCALSMRNKEKYIRNSINYPLSSVL